MFISFFLSLGVQGLLVVVRNLADLSGAVRLPLADPGLEEGDAMLWLLGIVFLNPLWFRPSAIALVFLSSSRPAW